MIRMAERRFWLQSARSGPWLALSVILAGCGQGDRPPLGMVSGVISIDGTPAPNVQILFSQARVRSSSGVTNEAGEYEMKYSKDVMGAVVGVHEVRIEYVRREEGKQRKQLPARYNRQSDLTREVERGSNTFDFDLETD